MVLGLLTASFVSIVSFVVASVLGFLSASSAGVSQHVLVGLFATFMVTLSQSMTMFYFIGTGKQVKDLVARQPAGAQFIQRTKVFKTKVFPPATWAMLFTMATMILGGGVHTRVLPTIIHSLLAAASLYFNVVAFWREVKYMIEHNMLMVELEKFLQLPAASGE